MLTNNNTSPEKNSATLHAQCRHAPIVQQQSSSLIQRKTPQSRRRWMVIYVLVALSLVGNCFVSFQSSGDQTSLSLHSKQMDYLRKLLDKEQTPSIASIVYFDDHQVETKDEGNNNTTTTLETTTPLTTTTTSTHNDATTKATTIPHRLIFTYRHNILDTKTPTHFYDNIQNTIAGYTKYWNSTAAVDVIFLDDTACGQLLANTTLSSYFHKEGQGSYKADMCRLAALYQYGGYYFDVDMELVQPFGDDTITFATAHEANKDGYFFQSFLAATPRHPVIARALYETVPHFYATRRYNRAAPHVWMGPYTLKQAYQQEEQYNHTSAVVVLQEINLDDYSSNDYTSIVRKRGRGCCCNYVVQDEHKNVYFFSRMVGAGPHCDFL